MSRVGNLFEIYSRLRKMRIFVEVVEKPQLHLLISKDKAPAYAVLSAKSDEDKEALVKQHKLKGACTVVKDYETIGETMDKVLKYCKPSWMKDKEGE